jgi:hypothetical protein
MKRIKRWLRGLPVLILFGFLLWMQGCADTYAPQQGCEGRYVQQACYCGDGGDWSSPRSSRPSMTATARARMVAYRGWSGMRIVPSRW